MLWPRDLKDCPRIECRDATLFRPRDLFFTRQWLQQFGNDSSKMQALRNLLWQDRRANICSWIGAPHELFDRTGALVWRGDYDDWGSLSAQFGSAASMPIRLPGQYEDAGTGLYYNDYRH
jgi:uncharacterized protein RhaS with RHS repeats